MHPVVKNTVGVVSVWAMVGVGYASFALGAWLFAGIN